MSAVHALEAALGVTPSAEVRRLRRLLYCGEWIESHALHMHLLHAPDFLGYESGLALAARLSATKSTADCGSRSTAINCWKCSAAGPFIRSTSPSADFTGRRGARSWRPLIPDFEWGLQAAVETTRWVAGFDFPQFERPYRMLALVASRRIRHERRANRVDQRRSHRRGGLRAALRGAARAALDGAALGSHGGRQLLFRRAAGPRES